MAENALGPGSVIADRFRLEDLLDEHSGARFWRATDLALARNVAVHVLPSGDPRAAATLEGARRSATVTDPHLLRVLDAIEEQGHLHVVHEWGSGVSLDRMLEDGPLEARKAAWLAREVADALVVAHRGGIAHGRLIPENVLVTELGAVKLIGFVVDSVLHGGSETGPHDPGGDVRNLAGVLYAGLTGRWPGSPSSVVPDAPRDNGAVLRPRQVRAGVPRPLDALCDEVLNSDGAGTDLTAALVQRRLGEFLGDVVTGADVDDRTTVLDVRSVQAALSADPEATQAMRVAGPDGYGLADTGEAPAPDFGPATGPVAGPATDSGTEATPHAVPGPVRLDQRDRAPRPGMGAGAPPDSWGPDALTDTGSRAAFTGRDSRPGGPWMRWGVALGVLLLIVLASVVAFDLGAGDRGGPGGDPDTAGNGDQSQELRSVEVAEARDFDPDGGGSGENPELVPRALDGDPATTWETKTYFDGPALAPYRSGVGVLLDLGSETDVGEVRLQLEGQGYDVALLAAPPESGAPTSPEGLEEVDAASGAGGEVVLSADEPVTTRYLVVWLTALPDIGDGFRGKVAEIDVRA